MEWIGGFIGGFSFCVLLMVLLYFINNKINIMAKKKAAAKKPVKKKARYRSAITGKLIKKEVADKNPDTTVKERLK